jgi:hypothetical protein
MPLAASVTSKVSLTHFQPSCRSSLVVFYIIFLCFALSSLHFLSPGHGLKSEPGHFSIQHLLSGWHSPLFFCPPDTDSRASRAISLYNTFSLVGTLLPFCVPRTRTEEQAGPFLYTSPSLWLTLSALFCGPRTRTRDNL